jgi:hypothetical protein
MPSQSNRLRVYSDYIAWFVKSVGARSCDSSLKNYEKGERRRVLIWDQRSAYTATKDKVKFSDQS